MADGNIGTRAVVTQFSHDPAAMIDALQFLEQGMELGAQLEQTAQVVASHVMPHIECADGSLGHANHPSKMVQHLMCAMQNFAHRASWHPVLVAPGRHGIVFAGRRTLCGTHE
jgi:hypothetical protein